MKQTWRRLALLGSMLTLSVALVACAGQSSAAGPEGANGDGGSPTAPSNGGGGGTPSSGGDPDRPVTDGDTPTRPGGGTGNGDSGNSGGGSGGGTGGAPGTGDPMYPTVEAPAPIDDLEVIVMESFPPQYAVSITSGLPSGCASYHDTRVSRNGTTIEIEVVNLIPAPSTQIACTMIYGMHQQTVNLGSDFDSGVQYTVHVNDETITFTAQ